MKIESNRSKLEPKGFQVIVIGYSLISQSYSVYNPITSRFSTKVNIQPDISMFYNDSVGCNLDGIAGGRQHSPTQFDLVEPEIFIIPEINVPELPAALLPLELPANIKPCELLDDLTISLVRTQVQIQARFHKKPSVLQYYFFFIIQSSAKSR